MPLIHGHRYRVQLKEPWRIPEFSQARRMIYNDDFQWCIFLDEEGKNIFGCDQNFAENNFDLVDITFGPEEYCMGDKYIKS
jgi:hypothetical protein